jgi:hypothetical protein
MNCYLHITRCDRRFVIFGRSFAEAKGKVENTRTHKQDGFATLREPALPTKVCASIFDPRSFAPEKKP